MLGTQHFRVKQDTKKPPWKLCSSYTDRYCHRFPAENSNEIKYPESGQLLDSKKWKCHMTGGLLVEFCPQMTIAD